MEANMTMSTRDKRPDAELAAEYKSQIEHAAIHSVASRALTAFGLLAAGVLAILAQLLVIGFILLGSAGIVSLLFLDALLYKNELASRSVTSLAPNLSSTLGGKEKNEGAVHADVTK
jgi:hypothetical protein